MHCCLDLCAGYLYSHATRRLSMEIICAKEVRNMTLHIIGQTWAPHLVMNNTYKHNVSGNTLCPFAIRIDSFCTGPGPPLSVYFTNITKSALTVTWLAPTGGVDSYNIWLAPYTELYNQSIANTNYTFIDLNASTKCTAHIRTIWREMKSSDVNAYTGKVEQTQT